MNEGNRYRMEILLDRVFNSLSSLNLILHEPRQIMPIFVKAVIRNDIEIFNILIEYQIEGLLH